jgi:hypothetical protein
MTVVGLCRRVVLDTNCFRGLKANDLQPLMDAGLQISVGQSAFYETWARAVHENKPGIIIGPARSLAAVVDPEYPIAPNRGDLVWRFSSERRRRERDRVTARYLAWACLNWSLISTGNIDVEILRKHGSDADDYLAKAGRSWQIYASRWKREEQLEAFRALAPGRRRSLFINHITSDLWRNGFPARTLRRRMHGFYSVIAWHMWSTAQGATQATANDSEDIASLMHLAEPAFLLTRDEKLITAVDASGTYQAPWVLRLADFVSGALPQGRPWGANARNVFASFVRSKPSARLPRRA